MRKIFVAVLLLCVGIPYFGGCSMKNKNNLGSEWSGGVYDFPIKPGTDEWIALESTLNRVAACQLPEEVLQGISTEDLAETVLRYPFIMEMMAAYDTFSMGFSATLRKFNGMTELVEREDAATVLLARYQSMDLDEYAEEGMRDKLYDMLNVEIMLSQAEFAQKLTEAEAIELEQEIEKKSLQKKAHPDFYGPLWTAWDKP